MDDDEKILKERRKRRLRNARTMILSPITGLGHLSMGYPLAGATLFCLFVLSLNGIFLGTVLLSDPRQSQWLLWVSVPMSILIWVFGILHSWRISFGRDRENLQQRRKELLQRSLIAYLRDQFGEAERLLKRAIRYDYDWEDAYLHFHLGVIALRRAARAGDSGDQRRAGKLRKAARRSFKLCLKRDPTRSWSEEILLECRQNGLRPPRGLLKARS